MTYNQVIDIFKLRDTAQQARRGAAIARSFGVTPKAIRDIWNLKTWADITSKYDTGTDPEHGPNKRCKRTKELSPAASLSSKAPSETNNYSIPTDAAMLDPEMPIPVACGRPVRFKAISHRQIDRILAKRKADVACAPFQLAPLPPENPPSSTSLARFNSTQGRVPPPCTATPPPPNMNAATIHGDSAGLPVRPGLCGASLLGPAPCSPRRAGEVRARAAPPPCGLWEPVGLYP